VGGGGGRVLNSEPSRSSEKRGGKETRRRVFLVERKMTLASNRGVVQKGERRGKGFEPSKLDGRPESAFQAIYFIWAE